MRILLLTHGFNGLTQRLFVELRERGHELSVEFDIADSVSEEAVALFDPDIVLAPFLKRRIPESIWSRRICLVVHPGPAGDRGPSALDWAVQRGEPTWGVTVLQANADFDAGEVWASVDFTMRDASKGSLYRREVTQAALQAVLAALDRFQPGRAVPAPVPALPPAQGHWQPLMRQHDRRIAWSDDDSATVLRKIRAADGHPGVLDAWFGRSCRLFDVHAASDAVVLAVGAAQPGATLARRGPALLRRTVDGAVWIGHVRAEASHADQVVLKRPASQFFAAQAAALPEWPVPLQRDGDVGDVGDVGDDEYDELQYREFGPEGARVGWLSFDFHNGAMSSRQCERLLQALRHARGRDTRLLVLAGGEDFFSNGIHLHDIEAAAADHGGSAADASWRNINAIDDVALEILTLTDRLTIALLRGNAGAGGCFLALAADEVWALPGVVLNPHYKNMGNLYGSEYWTYLLPRRLAARSGSAAAAAQARQIMQRRLPMGAAEALRLGLVDRVLAAGEQPFPLLLQRAGAADNAARVAAKQRQRMIDEATRPLAAYRQDELERMHRNFYGFDPSYHVARSHFVTRKAQAWTPRHLAVHRHP